MRIIIDDIMNSITNKELFGQIYGAQFQQKIDKLSDEQIEMLMNHILKINPNISYTLVGNYYLFNSSNLNLEDLKKILEYIEHL